MNRELLVTEIIELLPEFKGREGELKDIIDKLLQSRPEAAMDESFKEELKKRVIELASEKKKVLPFRKKLLYIIPSAAAAGLVLVLTLGVFMNPHTRSSWKVALSGGSVVETENSESLDLDISQTAVVVETEVAELVEEKVLHSLQPSEEEIQISPSPHQQEAPVLSRDRKDVTPSSNLRGSGDTSGYMAEQELLDDEISGLVMLEREKLDISSVSGDFNTEEYSRIYENDFFSALNDPLSTFSIDVDTASYSNVRRYLMNGSLPPADSVRIEEMINYFDYAYPEVRGEHPFEFHSDMSICPWNEENRLLFVGIQGERKNLEDLPPTNLVFLLDVSGSMSDANKLPLLKQSLEMLTKQLRPEDRVSIVVYAGAAGVVLEPTPGDRTEQIIGAFDRLEAGGSTAGGEGIELAYKLAEETFLKQGNNRIIIATDGDFNIGPSSTSETTRLIEEKRNKGIFLTVLGFGMGNYKDSRMEQLADKGNGNYAYIDTLLEAKKVLVNEISSTLFTIASDVKIQIEFNPYLVDSYRLIGYENRVMANQDFQDDTKDAGELGAGHSVTAIYEIVPVKEQNLGQDDLKYQDQNLNDQALASNEVMTIKFRYKNPGAENSTLIEEFLLYREQDFSELSDSFQFAAAVAQWAMLLRGSEYSGDGSYQWVLDTAREAVSADPYGLKGEFLNLVELSEVLN